MQKIIEKGDGFVETELERLEKLRSGKLSDKKKEQIGGRLNILSTFIVSKLHVKDELWVLFSFLFLKSLDITLFHGIPLPKSD